MAMLVSSVNVRGLTGRSRAKSCSHSIEMKVRTTVVKRKTFISLFTVQIHKVTAIYDNQRTIITYATADATTAATATGTAFSARSTVLFVRK
jgi:hypothetical protein